MSMWGFGCATHVCPVSDPLMCCYKGRQVGDIEAQVLSVAPQKAGCMRMLASHREAGQDEVIGKLPYSRAALLSTSCCW